MKKLRWFFNRVMPTLIFFAFIFSPNFGNSQSSPWTYTTTSNPHYIQCNQDLQLSISGINLSLGDYLGVFYSNATGELVCCGLLEWAGVSTQISAYPSINGSDGFSYGDQIIWKIYDISENSEYIGRPTYTSGAPYSEDGLFQPNGLSSLESLIAFQNTSPWSYTITSSSHAILIPEEIITLKGDSPFEFGDYIGAFYENQGQQYCAGYTMFTGSLNALTVWGDDNTTSVKDGFADGETFSWKLFDPVTQQEHPLITHYMNGLSSLDMFENNGISGINGLYFFSNNPGWNYTVTANNHTILLPEDANISFNNSDLNIGDYIGVFFSDQGSEICAGYTIWTGYTDIISAWADDDYTTVKDGFSVGDEFILKYWNSNNNMVYDGTAIYDQSFPNQGEFWINGLSRIEEFNATNFSVPWTFNNTGNNHIILIPQDLTVDLIDFSLSSGDYIGVFYDSIGTLLCGGYQLWSGANTSITAWGADTGFDGFQPGEEFAWKIWDHETNNSYTVYPTYDSSFTHLSNYAVNGVSGLISINSVPAILTQVIELNNNWNMFSSYIIPEDSSIILLMQDIINELVILKNSSGQVYWPIYQVNTIQTFHNSEGYLIKVNNACSLSVTGNLIIPNEYHIQLGTGWQMIPYLRIDPLEIEIALNSIASSLYVIKNDDGQVYWPMYNINMIGYMYPGEAYNTKMTQNTILTYPSN